MFTCAPQRNLHTMFLRRFLFIIIIIVAICVHNRTIRIYFVVRVMPCINRTSSKWRASDVKCKQRISDGVASLLSLACMRQRRFAKVKSFIQSVARTECDDFCSKWLVKLYVCIAHHFALCHHMKPLRAEIRATCYTCDAYRVLENSRCICTQSSVKVEYFCS